jgi:hypothetical protein
MRRIAIIDHNEHSLYIEDIDEELLESKYGGDEQKYIDDMYDLEKYSWDWIRDIEYLPQDNEGDFIEIEPTKIN